MSVLFIFVLFAIGLFLYDGIQDNFEQRSAFILSKDQTWNLIGRKDSYYDSFTDLDLFARNADSLDSYLRAIFASCIDCDPDKTDIIMRCVEEIDSDEDVWDSIREHASWINVDRLRAIPWKIGVFRGNSYEYGLPHTRYDTILIPEKGIRYSSGFMDTLLHEKLHAYQKIHPEDFQRYLDSNGFVRHSKRCNHDRVAANPDADEWVYMKDSEIFISKYSNDSGTIKHMPINDAKYDCPQEYAVYNLLAYISM